MNIEIYLLKLSQYLANLYQFLNRKYMSLQLHPKPHPANHSPPSQGIETPEPAQFKIQYDFISSLLSQYANQESKLGFSEKQLIQRDTQFIHKVVQIVAKSQAVQAEKSLGEEIDAISQQQCNNLHQMAQRHANANRFNQYSDSDQIPPQKICKCGCKRAQGDPLPFCKNQTDQYFFGPGIILYFYMIRKLIVLLIILGCIYGIFSLSTNIIHAPSLEGQCQQDDERGSLFFLCEYKWLSTIKNKVNQQTLIHIQLWLGLIISIIWILGIRLVRTFGRLLNKKIDSQLDSSSDYCIQVSNLPFGSYSEPELLKYLATLWRKYKGKQVQPVFKSVQIIYNVSKVREKLQRIIQSSNKIMGMVESFNSSQIEIPKENNDKKKNNQQNITEQNLSNKREEQIQEIEEEETENIWKISEQYKEQYILEKNYLLKQFEELEQYRHKFINNLQFRKELATDMALVQFSQSQQQTQFLKEIRQYRTTPLGDLKDFLIDKCFDNQEQSNLFKGRATKITRAPEPSDIHWGNCEKKFSYKRVALVWLITLFIIGTSFGVLMLIRFLRSTFPELNKFSILVSISIQIFNRIIWNVLCSCIQIQQNNTKTDNIMSIMNKSMLAQTINITVLPLIMNLVLKENIQGPDGLIGMALDYQFVVLIMMLNLQILNLPYQLKRIIICIPCLRNWMIRNKVKVVGKIDTTEEIDPVLKFYEGPPFPIAGGYIYMTAVIYQGMFFLHLQPTLIFFLIFNMSCFYLVNKYLLLRRCKIAELLDFIIFQTSCSLLQHAPLLYAIGSLVFLNTLGNESFLFWVPSMLIIIVWLLHMINPRKIMHLIVKEITNCILGDEQNDNINIVEQQDQTKVMKGIIKTSFCLRNMTKRRECYYKNSGLNDLLNYEGKIIEMKESEVNINKVFCERFNLNMRYQGSNPNKSTLTKAVEPSKPNFLAAFIKKPDNINIKVEKKKFDEPRKQQQSTLPLNKQSLE